MIKRLIALIMSITFVFSYSVNTLADEYVDTTEELSIEEIVEEDNQKKDNTEDDGTVAEEIPADFTGGFFDTGNRLSSYKEANSGLLQSSSLPDRYDSRNDNCITSVKNQNPYGTCWAFSAVGAGEATLVKQGFYAKDEIDLSELQLAYYVFHEFNDPMSNISEDYVLISNGENFLDYGGNDYFSMFTFSAWKGAVDETDVPYTDAYRYVYGNQVLDNSYAVDKDKVHLQNTYIVPMDNADIVKELIMQYGAVSCGIYYPDEWWDYFVDLTHDYPLEWTLNQSATDEANHAVVVIGWDDDFPIEFFHPDERPENPGAWLVKNSWGEENNSFTYIWISYEDLCVSNEDAFAYLFEEADNYDYNYQYDGGVTDYSFRYDNSIEGYANVYDVYGKDIQSLDAVAVAVAEDNINYELQIYRNPSEGNPLSGIPLLDNPQIGYITYAGYNTIKLNNPLRLYPGDSFSVVLKLHNSEGENARIFIDCEEDIYDDDLVISTLKNHVEEGQSFLVFDDGSFKDFATYYNNNQCARIKAYTTKKPISDTEKNIADCTVISVSPVTYTGEKAVPEVILSYEGVTLIKDVDYVLYCDDIDVGIANVIIYGKGDYAGKVSKTFTIEPADENVDNIDNKDNKDSKDNDDNKENSDNNNRDNTSENIVETVDMYRLYNPNSGEHFYTSTTVEKDNLVKLGWKYEGIGWKAPKISDTPVYRLYNKNAGDHHYTMSTVERDYLISLGWRYEGIGWYSDDSEAVPIYRQYNPNAKSGSHNYTASKSENDRLVDLGWRGEGIGWYGIK